MRTSPCNVVAHEATIGGLELPALEFRPGSAEEDENRTQIAAAAQSLCEEQRQWWNDLPKQPQARVVATIIRLRWLRTTRGLLRSQRLVLLRDLAPRVQMLAGMLPGRAAPGVRSIRQRLLEAWHELCAQHDQGHNEQPRPLGEGDFWLIERRHWALRCLLTWEVLEDEPAPPGTWQRLHGLNRACAGLMEILAAQRAEREMARLQGLEHRYRRMLILSIIKATRRDHVLDQHSSGEVRRTADATLLVPAELSIGRSSATWLLHPDRDEPPRFEEGPLTAEKVGPFSLVVELPAALAKTLRPRSSAATAGDGA